MNSAGYYNIRSLDEAVANSEPVPFIRSLYSCMNKIKGEGYTEVFENTSKGIHCISSNHYYLPAEYNIINFLRFQGNDKAGNPIILYIIETKDGLKGMLLKHYEVA